MSSMCLLTSVLPLSHPGAKEREDPAEGKEEGRRCPVQEMKSQGREGKGAGGCREANLRKAAAQPHTEPRMGGWAGKGPD